MMMLSSVSRGGPSILCVSLSSSKTSLTSRGVVFGQSSKRHHRQDRAAFSKSNRMTPRLRICAAAASAQKNNNNNNNNNNNKKRRRRKGREKKDEKRRTPRRWHSRRSKCDEWVKKTSGAKMVAGKQRVQTNLVSGGGDRSRRRRSECFIHDGPPYANGDLHATAG